MKRRSVSHHQLSLGCLEDLTPEQKLAVAIIEDSLEEVRKEGRYAQSAASFLCGQGDLDFWLEVIGIENKKILGLFKEVGQEFFDS